MKTSLTNDATKNNHKISFCMTRDFIKISEKTFIKPARNMKFLAVELSNKLLAVQL